MEVKRMGKGSWSGDMLGRSRRQIWEEIKFLKLI